jgi:hypothetical protein
LLLVLSQVGFPPHLSLEQQSRLLELESRIERGLSSFLEVGACLLTIRQERLYRSNYPSFEAYCQGRWNFSAHHGARIMRSIVVARNLLKNDDCPPLPENLSEALLRPLTPLEAPLQQAVWQLANKVSATPTPYVLRGIVTVVRRAIDRGKGDNGAGQPSRGIPKARTKLFWDSLRQLCASSIPPGFLLQGATEARAKEHLAACQIVVELCHELIGEIRLRFPRL